MEMCATYRMVLKWLSASQQAEKPASQHPSASEPSSDGKPPPKLESVHSKRASVYESPHESSSEPSSYRSPYAESVPNSFTEANAANLPSVNITLGRPLGSTSSSLSLFGPFEPPQDQSTALIVLPQHP
ncbi:hypothetical protein EJ02DRAFT_207109 [Clathrospora elynae]|uniref:Uncharacterized protein n=1 Tax=Clathrospora elynae TaxID=706981 RepID=A0A6A5SNE8_9PLEO|nr:hypothetical protein EJ02DRAFT_207109 [Clathrospora elynae]